MSKLIEFLEQADDVDLQRMRPFELADRWDALRDEVLRLVLNAVRGGSPARVGAVCAAAGQSAQLEVPESAGPYRLFVRGGASVIAERHFKIPWQAFRGCPETTNTSPERPESHDTAPSAPHQCTALSRACGSCPSDSHFGGSRHPSRLPT